MPLPAKAKTKDPSVRIRFPRPVLRGIDAEATASGRSRNSEIVFALGEYVRTRQAQRAHDESQPSLPLGVRG